MDNLTYKKKTGNVSSTGGTELSPQEQDRVLIASFIRLIPMFNEASAPDPKNLGASAVGSSITQDRRKSAKEYRNSEKGQVAKEMLGLIGQFSAFKELENTVKAEKAALEELVLEEGRESSRREAEKAKYDRHLSGVKEEIFSTICSIYRRSASTDDVLLHDIAVKVEEVVSAKERVFGFDITSSASEFTDDGAAERGDSEDSGSKLKP